MATKRRQSSLLSFMNTPASEKTPILYRVQQDHSHRCGELRHYSNFGVPKRGVARIAVRFARLLPYLTTNPAAAYGGKSRYSCPLLSEFLETRTRTTRRLKKKGKVGPAKTVATIPPC